MSIDVQRLLQFFARLAFMLGLAGVALSAQSMVISSADQKIDLTGNARVLLDPAGQLTFEQIKADPARYIFEPLPSNSAGLSLGFTEAAYWIRLDLSRQEEAPVRWVLEIPFVAIDQVQWFPPSGQPSSSGTMADLAAKQIFTRVHAFHVDLSTEPEFFYLRVQSSYPLTVPLELMRADVFSKQQLLDTMLQFLYYGGLLALFFYNLLIFLTNRDRRYLLYCLFALSVGLAVFSGNGYGRLFLWPDWGSFDRISQGMFFSLAAAFGLLFTSEFLQLRQRAVWVYWTLTIFVWAELAIGLGLLASVFAWVPVALLYLLNFSLSTLGIIVCVSVAICLVAKGVREARYFVLSWGFLALGAITATLRAFDLVPSNVLTLYAVQIGSGFEALFFSFALADRLRSERMAREQAQAHLVDSQQETVRALRVTEERLEQAVDLRTQELRALLVKEQQVREQYVRFGAMIAHEFRNPLNVIEAQNTLIELDPDSGMEKTHKRASVIRSAVTRLATLFDQWLQSDRLSQAFAKITPLPIDTIGLIEDVVNSSRPYHPDHKILSFSTQSALVVRADYGLLRMATLNLIDNACKYSPDGSTVCVGVEWRDDWVGLYVKDEGPGIALDNQKTIFEPYVQLPSTERLVGVGLGLSFVRRIAELHEGRVEVQSRLGHGATFTIWIKRFIDG
jgi:signal transduction histidine kinase